MTACGGVLCLLMYKLASGVTVSSVGSLDQETTTTGSVIGAGVRGTERQIRVGHMYYGAIHQLISDIKSMVRSIHPACQGTDKEL